MNLRKRKASNSALRQYLLGSLPESQMAELEERVLTDAGTYEELLITEDELVDEYLSEKLSEQERHLFESHFSISKEHRNKIRFGETLKSYLNLHRVAPQEERAKVFSLRWLHENQRLTASLALVVCLGVLALSWTLYRWYSQSNSPGHTLAVTLVPGTSRSLGQRTQRLQRPQADTQIIVNLEMASNDYQSYKVEMIREGAVLATFQPLTASADDGHFVIELRVSSTLMDIGDYQFSLSGLSDSQRAEFKDQYPLRITQ